MKTLYAFVAVIVFLTVASAEVKKATSSNFDQLIGATDLTLVKFFAPWCGHCKKLAPEYEAAAEKLGSEVTLIDLDCTQEDALCKRYPVQGYPTLIFFRNGKQAENYEGARTTDGIVSYIKSNLGPALKTAASADALAAIKVDSSITCVVVTKSADTEAGKIISALANKMRTAMSFVLVTDPSIIPGSTTDSIIAYIGKEERVFSESLTEEAVKSFLDLAQIPMFGELSPQTYTAYGTLMESIPMGWVFLDKDSDESIKAALEEFARKKRKEIILLWLNADLYGSVGQQMALPKEVKYPAFVINRSREPFVHPLEPATAASIIDFTERFLKGEIKATLQSEEVPNPETKDGLTTLVGKSLPEYLKKDKDIFLFFYAPWCGHCKTLHPIYDQLAKALEKEDVVVAKLDATANAFPREIFKIEGYPTLFFIPAGKEPLSYEGDRSLENMLQFVKEQTAGKTSVEDADL